jgi:hypothetical protein
MQKHVPKLTRPSVLVGGAVSVLHAGTTFAAGGPVITVHRDPDCGCCGGWVQHLQDAAFRINGLETKDLDAVKKALGVPDDLAACHTAEASGYVIEGHVPAAALKRLFAEKPNATDSLCRGCQLGTRVGRREARAIRSCFIRPEWQTVLHAVRWREGVRLRYPVGGSQRSASIEQVLFRPRMA